MFGKFQCKGKSLFTATSDPFNLPVPYNVSKSLPKTDKISLLPTATWTMNITKERMEHKVPGQHKASGYLALLEDLLLSTLSDVLLWG